MVHLLFQAGVSSARSITPRSFARTLAAAVAVMIAIDIASTEAASVTFSVTPLQTPAGTTSPGVNIYDSVSAAGFVVGSVYDTTANTNRAVRWNATGAATLLSNPPDATSRMGFGVNDAGEAVGYVRINGEDRPLRWDATGSPTLLGSQTGRAFALNNSGNAVGYAKRPGNTSAYHAIRWDASGAATVLGKPTEDDSDAEPYSLSENDLAAGTGLSSVGSIQATRWNSAGTAVALSPNVYQEAFALGINNSAVAVGQVDGFPARWSADGEVLELSAPGGGRPNGGVASGIDDSNRAVGYAGVLSTSGSENRAVLWDTDGTPHYLHDLLTAADAGWTFTRAMGIDDNAEFVRAVAFRDQPGRQRRRRNLCPADCRRPRAGNRGPVGDQRDVPAAPPASLMPDDIGLLVDLKVESEERDACTV